MFQRVQTRGVLHKAMCRNTQHISVLSFMLYMIPLIIIALTFTPESTIGRICSAFMLWYMVCLFLLKRIDFENGNLGKIIAFPIFSSLKLSVIIFKFILIRKYPEMEEEHYQRWVKLKRIKKQIKTK